MLGIFTPDPPGGKMIQLDKWLGEFNHQGSHGEIEAWTTQLDPVLGATIYFRHGPPRPFGSGVPRSPIRKEDFFDHGLFSPLQVMGWSSSRMDLVGTDYIDFLTTDESPITNEPTASPTKQATPRHTHTAVIQFHSVCSFRFSLKIFCSKCFWKPPVFLVIFVGGRGNVCV